MIMGHEILKNKLLGEQKLNAKKNFFNTNQNYNGHGLALMRKQKTKLSRNHQKSSSKM